MASVVARLDIPVPALGEVLPIDCYLTDDDSFAVKLSHGGSLYLIAGTRLVAVIETPERSGLLIGDKRKPGWYGPENTIPVTELGRFIKVGDEPRLLTVAQEKRLRARFDAPDAPVARKPKARAKLTSSTAPPLERAYAYLRTDRVEQAIAMMSEAWRATRVPVVADLVDRATRLLPIYHQPLFDRRRGNQRHIADQVWDAAYRDDPIAAMPQLLFNLVLGSRKLLHKRIERLLELPLDPRLAIRVAELFSGIRSQFTRADWWSPFEKLWELARDARISRAFHDDEPPESWSDEKRRRYGLWKEPAPEPSAADVPVIAGIETELHRLEEPYRTECALVDEIAANPDIDDPYLVYADWLLERDRPLGELIALSCQRKRTPTQARRHAQLLALPYLHGPFEDLPGHRHPRPRGIDLDIMVPWKTSPRTWEVAATSPLVRALTRIEMVGPAIGGLEHAMAKLVAAAPALERISHLSKETGHALLELVDGFELEPSGEIATPVRAHAPFRLRGSYEPTFGVTLIRVGRSR